MSADLAAQQSLIRAAISKLEAGASVCGVVYGSSVYAELVKGLRHALVEHDDEGCSVVGRECLSVSTARLVLEES